MQLGIFAKTFRRSTLEAVFTAVAAHGLSCVQFSFESTGLPSMPDAIDPTLAARIRSAAEASGVAIAALSGTFNMIHPRVEERALGLRRLETLAAACGTLGTRVINLCTGSRDPDDMWRRHPENDSISAWRYLLESMETAIGIAERHDLLLGIEPERGNVISSAARAKRLLDELGSPRLGIVMDAANLIEDVPPERIEAVLDEAVALLGDRILLAHGKDRAADGRVVPAGQGVVPWPRFVAGLRDVGFAGALILHGLEEPDVPGSVAHLQPLLKATV